MNESSLTLLEEEILYNKTIQKKRQMHWTLYQSLHRQPIDRYRDTAWILWVSVSEDEWRLMTGRYYY